MKLIPLRYIGYPIATNPVFASWYRQNTRVHKQSGYRIVFLSLKNHGEAPGDISASQMEEVAALADQYSFGEIRTTYSQNLILAQVEQTQVFPLWQALTRLKLTNPNIGTANDIICCPGFDFCALADATSIDVSEDINRRFESLDRLYDVGHRISAKTISLRCSRWNWAGSRTAKLR